MTQSKPPRRPSHAVYLVEGEGENTYWTKIGRFFKGPMEAFIARYEEALEPA